MVIPVRATDDGRIGLRRNKRCFHILEKRCPARGAERAVLRPIGGHDGDKPCLRVGLDQVGMFAANEPWTGQNEPEFIAHAPPPTSRFAKLRNTDAIA